MSVYQVSLALDLPVKPVHKIILISLADASNDMGESYSANTVAVLASRADVSERTVTRALNDLQKMGYIKRFVVGQKICVQLTLGKGKAQSETKINREKRKPAVAPQLEEGFAEFWQAYPRRQAKQDAFKAYKQVKPDPATLEQIINHVHRMCKTEDWQRERGKFIPLPASYLRGRRWEDEPDIDLPEPPPKKKEVVL